MQQRHHLQRAMRPHAHGVAGAILLALAAAASCWLAARSAAAGEVAGCSLQR